MEGYETVEQAAIRLGRSESYIRRMCKQERIAGAVKIGDPDKGPWVIPVGSHVLPVDASPKADKIRAEWRGNWHKYQSPSSTATH